MGGCYNTAVCKFDGGDCCEDTCISDEGYVECGHDGFACRDPFSEFCDHTLTRKCEKQPDNIPDPDSVKCGEGETKYRLIMFDSFGDGWDTTEMTIGDKKNPIFKGQLKDGAQGTEYICLDSTSKCYDVNVEGGTWGVEVSWEIRGMKEGSPTGKFTASLKNKCVVQLSTSYMYVLMYI